MTIAVRSSVPLGPASRPAGHVVVAGLTDVDATVARLVRAIDAEGLLLVHAIDPQRILAASGYEIPPIRQLLFFHPRYMARLLGVDPAAVIEVPLKLVVQSTPDGGVTVRFADPRRTLGAYPGLGALASELFAIGERLLRSLDGARIA
jgi:uncharacterized protein (DUF302 family)